jgi:hypothetical protein
MSSPQRQQLPQPTDVAITDHELAAILDGIATDNLALLQDLMSARRRHDGKIIQREVARLAAEALATLGYCWVRTPAEGDPLYHDMDAAMYDVGQVNRIAYTSDNEHVRKSAATQIASRMMKHWRESNTAVVRRKPQ